MRFLLFVPLLKLSGRGETGEGGGGLSWQRQTAPGLPVAVASGGCGVAGSAFVDPTPACAGKLCAARMSVRSSVVSSDAATLGRGARAWPGPCHACRHGVPRVACPVRPARRPAWSWSRHAGLASRPSEALMGWKGEMERGGGVGGGGDGHTGLSTTQLALCVPTDPVPRMNFAAPALPSPPSHLACCCCRVPHTQRCWQRTATTMSLYALATHDDGYARDGDDGPDGDNRRAMFLRGGVLSGSPAGVVGFEDFYRDDPLALAKPVRLHWERDVSVRHGLWPPSAPSFPPLPLPLRDHARLPRCCLGLRDGCPSR